MGRIEKTQSENKYWILARLEVVIFEIAVIFMSFLAYSYPVLMIFVDFGLFCFVYKTISGSNKESVLIK